MVEQGAMAVTGTRKAEHGVRADYLRGDPSQEGPITRGMLALEAQELRFSVPDGPELKMQCQDLVRETANRLDHINYDFSLAIIHRHGNFSSARTAVTP